MSSEILENLSQNLAGAATTRLASRAIGIIPVAGDVASFLIDTGMDDLSDSAEARQNLADSQASVNALRDVQYCQNFWLTTVIIQDGSAAQQILMYPSADTANIIQNVNQYVIDEDVAISQYGLTPPIDLADVINNPAAVSALLSDIDESDKDYILNPRH
jgi:hypothetical protein